MVITDGTMRGGLVATYMMMGMKMEGRSFLRSTLVSGSKTE